LLTNGVRTPYALVDDEGRIFALLCGRPGGKDWDGVVARGTAALMAARERVWSDGCQRRGKFVNASAGVLIGQGGKARFPLRGLPVCDN
jgi:hypothetical protein